MVRLGAISSISGPLPTSPEVTFSFQFGVGFLSCVSMDLHSHVASLFMRQHLDWGVSFSFVMGSAAAAVSGDCGFNFLFQKARNGGFLVKSLSIGSKPS